MDWALQCGHWDVVRDLLGDPEVVVERRHAYRIIFHGDLSLIDSLCQRVEIDPTMYLYCRGDEKIYALLREYCGLPLLGTLAI